MQGHTRWCLRVHILRGIWGMRMRVAVRTGIWGIHQEMSGHVEGIGGAKVISGAWNIHVKTARVSKWFTDGTELAAAGVCFSH